MQIREILNEIDRPPVTTRADATLLDVLASMVRARVGAVVVTDEGGSVVGIVTQRDVLAECFASPSGWARSTASHVMTAEVVRGAPSDLVADAQEKMARCRIHHLPIVDEGGLVGVLSASDLVQASLVEHGALFVRYLRGEDVEPATARVLDGFRPPTAPRTASADDFPDDDGDG